VNVAVTFTQRMPVPHDETAASALGRPTAALTWVVGLASGVSLEEVGAAVTATLGLLGAALWVFRTGRRPGDGSLA